MANSITLFKQTLSDTLDEVYKLSSLTAILDGSADLVKQGANANELIIPKMSVQGLADYDKASGYVSGDVTLTNETVQCNFDRGRMFTVDSMDDLETAGVAYGRLAGELIRTKVLVPQTRFYTAVDMLDGTTSGQEAGGYVKGSTAKNINFMVIHRGAVIQFLKHVAPKVILPDVNQSTDGYKFGYRHVAIADVYENKAAGIYLHYATA